MLDDSDEDESDGEVNPPQKSGKRKPIANLRRIHCLDLKTKKMMTKSMMQQTWLLQMMISLLMMMNMKVQ